MSDRHNIIYSMQLQYLAHDLATYQWNPDLQRLPLGNKILSMHVLISGFFPITYMAIQGEWPL
jgi:hypothetical protein